MAKITSDHSSFFICYEKWAFLSACKKLDGFERVHGHRSQKMLTRTPYMRGASFFDFLLQN